MTPSEAWDRDPQGLVTGSDVSPPENRPSLPRLRGKALAGRKAQASLMLMGLLFLCVGAGFAKEIVVRRVDPAGSERKLRSESFNGLLYVEAEDLASALGARVFSSSKAPKVVLSMVGSEVTITAWNPFVIIDGVAYQLLDEVVQHRDAIWLPADQFLSLLARHFSDRLAYDERTGVLEIRLVGRDIISVTTEDKLNGILIRIRTSRPFDEKHISTRYSHGWLYVDVYGGVVDSTQVRVVNRSKAVRKVVTMQLGETAQIAFRLSREIGERQVMVQESPPEVWVSLRTSEAVSDELLENLRREREKWVIDAVVIDPGHGGFDPGAIGPGGTREKDVTLAIAKRLKNYLEKQVGVKVYLTREDDRFVPLRERTKFANRVGAKLFISIHANANRSRRLGGVTTYFLGPAKTEEAREVARLENSAIRYESDLRDYGDLEDENFILAAIAQNAFQQESQDLAALIQQSLCRNTRLDDGGVRQAGYYVLIGAAMPNVLVETAFISNPREEKLLRSREFQDSVAKAIAEGVKAFKSRYEREWAASH